MYPDNVISCRLRLVGGSVHLSDLLFELFRLDHFLKWLCINLSIMLIFHNKIKLISQMRPCYEDAWNNLA